LSSNSKYRISVNLADQDEEAIARTPVEVETVKKYVVRRTPVPSQI
jgi:hypothetical protein